MKNHSPATGLFESSIAKFDSTPTFLFSVTLAFLVIAMVACGGYGKQAATVSVNSLTISPSTASQSVGATQQFTAIASFSDATTRDVTSQAAWTSNATATATVTQTGGLEAALAPGDATISASFRVAGATVSASAVLRVTLPAPQAITISPAIDQLELGANQQFTATARLADGTTQDFTHFVSWSSSDQNVIRVNTTTGRVGLGNTRGPGTATIRASVNGVSASTSKTVVRRVPKFLYAAGLFGIDSYAINPVTGALNELPGSRFTAVGVITSLAVTRDRRFLYAADPVAGVTWAFRIDLAGTLTQLPDSPFSISNTSSPISVVAHPAADFLFMTDANTGKITTFTIAANGSLTTVAAPASVGPQPLFATVSPDGKFLFNGLHLGASASIAGFSIATNGALSALSGTPAATGFRPNTLTVEQSGHFLYATIPNSSLGTSTSVFGYAIDPVAGTLAPVTGSPFNAGESPISAAADASGRFLYVANNANSDTGNSVSGFSIDFVTGTLAILTGSPFAAPTSPTSITIDPSAQYAYVSLTGSQGVRAYAIDQVTGALTEISGSPFAAPGEISTMVTTF